MLMLALSLFLKNKGGGKQDWLIPFVGSNLGVETFLKKMEHQKMMRYNRGLMHLCIVFIEVSRKFYVKPVCLLIFFFGYKRNSESSIFFHSLIIEFLWLASQWLKFEEKIYIKIIIKVSSEEHPSSYWW